MKKGFTLIELMVVILIVGILAAAAIPLMKGRIDSAKWAEANATAGTVKSAVRVYFAESGDTTLAGTLDDATIQGLLGFDTADLTGTYFDPADYEITDITDNGIAEVTVTGDGVGDTPEGTYVLGTDGSWEKQAAVP